MDAAIAGFEQNKSQALDDMADVSVDIFNILMDIIKIGVVKYSATNESKSSEGKSTTGAPVTAATAAALSVGGGGGGTSIVGADDSGYIVLVQDISMKALSVVEIVSGANMGGRSRLRDKIAIDNPCIRCVIT